MEKELNSLGHILATPRHPFAALLGGAKVGDKINLIRNILDKVDMVLIGGGMAATFLKNTGYDTGRSLIEPDKLEFAHDLTIMARQNGVLFLLPVDVVVSDSFDAPLNVKPFR
jgi:phosphoglycerate kinase